MPRKTKSHVGAIDWSRSDLAERETIRAHVESYQYKGSRIVGVKTWKTFDISAQPLPKAEQGKEKDTFAFRYISERERFYERVRELRKQIGDKYGDVVQSGLSVVLEIGKFGSHKRAEHLESGKYRGIRTFVDLAQLRRFLFKTYVENA